MIDQLSISRDTNNVQDTFTVLLSTESGYTAQSAVKFAYPGSDGVYFSGDFQVSCLLVFGASRPLYFCNRVTGMSVSCISITTAGLPIWFSSLATELLFPTR